MAALVRITVDDPQNVLDTYGAGALFRVERDTTSAMSAPTEVTTVVVVAGTTEYEYADATGVAGLHWYQVRYSTDDASDSADYSDYGAPFQAGAPGGEVVTLEGIKTWAGNTDTADDKWLALGVGAMNRALISAIGVDIGPSPDTTRTYDACAATRDGRRLTIPGGIREVVTVQGSSDGTTWTDITSSVRISPSAHERPVGEPGTWIEYLPHVSGAFTSWVYIKVNVTAFRGFGWDAYPLDLVQEGDAAMQRMAADRDRQGQWPTETTARRYLDKDLMRDFRTRYFAMVR